MALPGHSVGGFRLSFFFLQGLERANAARLRQIRMWSSPLFWMAFAIALFWALGAYNRLMRLRSAVVQTFGGLDAHMLRLVALLGECSASHETAHGAQRSQDLAPLQGATVQLSASLAGARARPLAADAVAALAAAREVLHATWQAAAPRLGLPQAQDGAMPANDAPPGAMAAPSVWQLRWDEHAQQNEQAIRVFNEAVAQYNAAIAQFPASILAWVFGFKAARAL